MEMQSETKHICPIDEDKDHCGCSTCDYDDIQGCKHCGKDRYCW